MGEAATAFIPMLPHSTQETTWTPRSQVPRVITRFDRLHRPSINYSSTTISPDSPSGSSVSPASLLAERAISLRPRQLSTASTSLTASTAPTSLFSQDVGITIKHRLPSTAGSSDIDAWFARFRSDEDLSAGASDEYPDRATLSAVRNLPVYGEDGEMHSFGSLYEPETSIHQRQLFVFVRHFYCGACQAYIKALAENISVQDYFSIPIPTSIIVIGCGQPDLIPQYKRFTSCPFPIYADPSREIFKKLGMSISFNLGMKRPGYMKDISTTAWLGGQAKSMHKSLKDPDGIHARDIFRGGNPMQIGGEFLFEDGEVVWCHRMKNYRNHAEIDVVRRVLQLDE